MGELLHDGAAVALAAKDMSIALHLAYSWRWRGAACVRVRVRVCAVVWCRCESLHAYVHSSPVSASGRRLAV